MSAFILMYLCEMVFYILTFKSWGFFTEIYLSLSLSLHVYFHYKEKFSKQQFPQA